MAHTVSIWLTLSLAFWRYEVLKNGRHQRRKTGRRCHQVTRLPPAPTGRKPWPAPFSLPPVVLLIFLLLPALPGTTFGLNRPARE